MKKKIRVAELFAGVGGFRIGLGRAGEKGKGFEYEVVWSSQWEPGSKVQHASEIYVRQFGDSGHSNEDVQKVVENNIEAVADHDLLVGGFPCQDYSVARTLNQAEGLKGKKGVLWWSIYGILKKKGRKAPRYLMLENVDRLLKSPASRRGRDFAVMLSSLAELGYVVEWRIINAAEYGFPQRRRRVFIMAYRKNAGTNRLMRRAEPADWLMRDGVIAKAFPVHRTTARASEFVIDEDPAEVSETFSEGNPTKSPFENAGMMIDGKVYTMKVVPKPDPKRKPILLGDVIEKDEKNVPKTFLIGKDELETWKGLKGGKKERRKTKSGHVYYYSEGPMIFPDPLDRPSRTIVTGEGGRSASRFKHAIETKSGELRRLMPIELERLNMFPDDHTRFMLGDRETPDTKRAFIMGNALVVGVIEELGKSLGRFIAKEG